MKGGVVVEEVECDVCGGTGNVSERDPCCTCDEGYECCIGVKCEECNGTGKKQSNESE